MIKPKDKLLVFAVLHNIYDVILDRPFAILINTTLRSNGGVDEAYFRATGPVFKHFCPNTYTYNCVILEYNKYNYTYIDVDKKLVV